ncbi:MAG: YncE family protein [Comamonas sp.]
MPRSLTTLALAAALALGLAACAQQPARTASAAPATTTAAAAPASAPAAPVADARVIRRELAHGVYEIVYSPVTDAIYVATTQSITGVKGGVIYKLDPRTLEVTGQTHTDLKDFGLTTNPSGDTLYVTNSISSGISAVDVKSGEVKARLKFNDLNPDKTPLGPRQVIYNAANDTLYVGGVGNPGVIWVVDAKTLKLKTRITNAGKWVTGLLIDPATKRLYAANGSGEVLVIDTVSNKIRARWTPGDGKEYLLLNFAHDPKTHRLFVTDHSQGKTTLVFDDRTGKVIDRLPVGDSLGIKLNPVRNELYITRRDAGKLLVLDATSYAVKKSYDLPPNPNSLLLSADGQVLYATVKVGFNKDYSTPSPDSVVRIALD